MKKRILIFGLISLMLISLVQIVNADCSPDSFCDGNTASLRNLVTCNYDTFDCEDVVTDGICIIRNGNAICEVPPDPNEQRCYKCGRNGDGTVITKIGVSACDPGWTTIQLTPDDCTVEIQCWQCGSTGTSIGQTVVGNSCPSGWQREELSTRDCGAAFCGNGACESGETSFICPEDCGVPGDEDGDGESDFEVPVCCQVNSARVEWREVGDCAVQTISTKCEESNAKICSKMNGQGCELKENLPGADDSQQTIECSSGWCHDKLGIGGVCEKAPKGREGHPLCDIGEEFDVCTDFVESVGGVFSVDNPCGTGLGILGSIVGVILTIIIVFIVKAAKRK